MSVCNAIWFHMFLKSNLNQKGPGFFFVYHKDIETGYVNYFAVAEFARFYALDYSLHLFLLQRNGQTFSPFGPL